MPTRIRVSIGPEVGNVTAVQVENVVRDAHRKGYDDVDGAAQEAIADASHPNLRLLMALISPDVAMGGLLKDQPGSQFCIHQAFFPDRTKWDKPARALGSQCTVDPAAVDALSGFRSRPSRGRTGSAKMRPGRWLST